jgi:hypothetical protein
MQKLRSIHLYLGCIFAPLLLFFAISGIWQTAGFRTPALQLLSTIHTAARLKNGHDLGSPMLKIFVILMAVSFVITTILGVVMALKYGRSRKAAVYCLSAGFIVPVVLVLLRAVA